MLDIRQIAGVVALAVVGLLILYVIYSAATFILANIGWIAFAGLAGTAAYLVYARLALH